MNAQLLLKSSLNDELERSYGGTVLRWQWSKPGEVRILNRADGPDTTVVGDELRLLEAAPGVAEERTLSELILRGHDLGSFQIRSEELKKKPGRTP